MLTVLCTPAAGSPTRTEAAELCGGGTQGDGAAEAHISNRSGAVLGKQTILKEEPYPGIHNSAIPLEVEGAANFRQAGGGLPIYGLAISPLAAIKRVLQRVGAAPGGGGQAAWHNMREETTVYINGTPYVLREAARPLGNMQACPSLLHPHLLPARARGISHNCRKLEKAELLVYSK